MFLLVPYRVDVPLYRRPIANYVLLALLVVCYIIEQTRRFPASRKLRPSRRSC